MTGEPWERGQNPLTGPWGTFKAWHREASLWREVYARTLSALIAATVIYAVAAISGLVSNKPLIVVGVLLVVATSPYVVWQWADLLVHRKDLRMSKDWSVTPPRNYAERRIRSVYSRTLAPTLVWVAGVVLVVLLAMGI